MAANSTLDYRRQEHEFRAVFRVGIKVTLIVTAAILLFVTAIYAWPRIQIQRVLATARTWKAPIGIVAFDETPAAVALLAKPDYSDAARGGPSPLAIYRPAFAGAFFDYIHNGMDHQQFAVIASGVLRAGGHERLAFICMKRFFSPTSDSFLFEQFIIAPTVPWEATKLHIYGQNSTSVGALTAGPGMPRNFRVIMGQPDPADASQMLIDMEAYGRRLTFKVRLTADDHLVFIDEDQFYRF